MTIKWTDSLAIGVDIVDQEHQAIIKEFNRLYDLMRTGKGHGFYKEFIHFLMDYVDDHLKHEEELMAFVDYQDVISHKRAHDDFRQQVIDLENHHRVGKVSNKDLLELNLMVKDWLVHHIQEVDMKLGDFIREGAIDLAGFTIEE